MERKRVRCLADVNVLLAGLWDFLPEHGIALNWLKQNRWAYCAITEVGCIRISLQPAFQQHTAINSAALAGVYKELTHACKAVRWSALRPFHASLLLHSDVTAAQITDLYLCDLASQHGGKLITLDDRLHRLHPDHTVLVPIQ